MIAAAIGAIGGIVFSFAVLNFDDKKWTRFWLAYLGFILAILAQHL